MSAIDVGGLINSLDGQTGGGGGGGLSIGGSGGGYADLAGDVVNYISAAVEGNQLQTGINHAGNALTAGYQTARGDYAPYTALGQTGANRLSQIGNFSFTPGDLTQDPGYQFQKAQGEAGVNASAAARGLGMSGATAEAMDYFNQQLAGTSYQNAYNRALEGYKTNVAGAEYETGVGAQAANQLSNLDYNYGTNQANLELARGSVRAGTLKGVLTAGGSALETTINSAASQGAGGGGNTLSNIGSADAEGTMGGYSGYAGPDTGVPYSYDPYSGSSGSANLGNA
jgi:hypothetical protein